MLLLNTWVACLVLWIVLWSFGVKALDGFILVIAIMVGAVAAHVIIPLLPGNRRD